MKNQKKVLPLTEGFPTPNFWNVPVSTVLLEQKNFCSLVESGVLFNSSFIAKELLTKKVAAKLQQTP